MFFSSLLLASLATGIKASPVPRAVKSFTVTDTLIQQYALTLEHLEDTFYRQSLEQFDATAFANAGFVPLVRERFEQISQHEATHVALLTASLGADAPAACTYNFPVTDPKSFAALSMIFEGVGTSAYLGASHLITDKTLLTTAGSILTTEARQQAWVSASVEQASPWSGAFDTPLDFNQVFSLAAPFIVSCPSTNPSLPFTAFPALKSVPAAPNPGDSISLVYNTTASSSSTFLALFSGLDTLIVPIATNTVTLPSNLTGTVYGVVTTSGTDVTDDNTLAGPMIFQFPDPTPSS